MLHGLEGGVFARSRVGVDATGVLLGEEALGNHNIEIDGQANSSQRNAQHQRLMSQHPAKARGVTVINALECGVACPSQPIELLVFLRFEEFGAHRRRRCQGYDHRERHSHAQCDGELPKNSSENASHQQNGDEHRDQRGAHGEDCKSNLACSPERSFDRGESPLEIARNVFDHHDGVVYNEAGGNREGHQREVIDGVAQQVHHAEGAHQREGHDHARYGGGPGATEKKEDHQDDHKDGDDESDLNIADRGADHSRAQLSDLQVDRGRNGSL